MDEGLSQALSKYKRGLSCLVLRGGLTVILGLSAMLDPNWTLDIFAGHYDGTSDATPFALDTSRAAKLARKCAMIAGVYTCVWGVMMILSAAKGTCSMMRAMAASSGVHGASCIALGAIEGKSTLFVVALPFITLDVLAYVYSAPKIVRVNSEKTLYFHGAAQGLDGMDAPGTTMKRINSHCELRMRAPISSSEKAAHDEAEAEYLK